MGLAICHTIANGYGGWYPGKKLSRWQRRIRYFLPKAEE